MVVTLEGVRSKPIEIRPVEHSVDDLEKEVAEIILDVNRYDIRKLGKTLAPDISYTSLHTIGVWMSFKVEKALANFHIRMGGRSLPNAWLNHSGSHLFDDGSDRAMRIYKIIVNELDYDYAAIGSYCSRDVDEEEFSNWLLNCTYFSKRGNFTIPPDMPGVDYDENDRDVYISIGGKLCKSANGPVYQIQKQIRLEATRRIKQSNSIN